jgi:Skp family chaperone for outer membrane proteins
MTDGLDMSEYITRHELQSAIATLATQRELEIWSGALVGRMDARFETLELHIGAMQRNMEAMQRDLQRDLRRDLDAMRSELQADLARHAHAIFESTQAMFRALAEQSAGATPR